MIQNSVNDSIRTPHSHFRLKILHISRMGVISESYIIASSPCHINNGLNFFSFHFHLSLCIVNDERKKKTKEKKKILKNHPCQAADNGTLN